MKKLIGVVSVMFLGLFLSSAMASETPMEEQSQANQPAIQEESQSALEKFAVWPFEAIEKNSGNEAKNTIDSVKVDLSQDVDGKTYFPVQDDESD